jgi:hypothetical protein
MILALASALMVAIHVAVASEARPSPERRVFPSLFFEAAYPYAPLLAAVFAPIHVAGAAAYLTGVLGRFATERQLQAYGVYEAELAALLYLLYLL